MGTKRGVTWLELIFTGLIVFVLILFLLPFMGQFSQANRNPHGLGDASNEDQLGLALAQYAQDNDKRAPSGFHGTGIGWAGDIYPYVKSSGVYTCPNNAMTANEPECPVSYALNENAPGHTFLQWGSAKPRIILFEVANDEADVTSADEGRSLGETSFSAVGNGIDGTLRGGTASAQYATGDIGSRPYLHPTQQGPPRNHGGSYYLYFDGHVSWLLASEVSSGQNAHVSHDSQTGRRFGDAAGTANRDYKATFSVK